MKNPSRKIIDENDKLRIEHEWESTYLINKLDGDILWEDDFYGEPTCALIDQDNIWAIVAGIHLVLWKPNFQKTFYSEQFKWIHSIRLKNNQIVEILTDPWNEISAIWELDIIKEELIKISDFKKYLGKEYIETIDW